MMVNRQILQVQNWNTLHKVGVGIHTRVLTRTKLSTVPAYWCFEPCFEHYRTGVTAVFVLVTSVRYEGPAVSLLLSDSTIPFFENRPARAAQRIFAPIFLARSLPQTPISEI